MLAVPSRLSPGAITAQTTERTGANEGSYGKATVYYLPVAQLRSDAAKLAEHSSPYRHLPEAFSTRNQNQIEEPDGSAMQSG